jgi:hypothetical protein
MPEGLARVMDILQTSIAPRRIGEPEKPEKGGAPEAPKK